MTPPRPPARELHQDPLHALACATGRLAEALRELEYAREIAPPGAAASEPLLQEVRDRLWTVIVQREALGIRGHAVLLEVLRVPPEVRSVPWRVPGSAPA
jgi:hypothetical protein